MEPIEGSETSAFKPQTPGKYPKENIIHKEHGESLKSRHQYTFFLTIMLRKIREFVVKYGDGIQNVFYLLKTILYSLYPVHSNFQP